MKTNNIKPTVLRLRMAETIFAMKDKSITGYLVGVIPKAKSKNRTVFMGMMCNTVNRAKEYANEVEQGETGYGKRRKTIVTKVTMEIIPIDDKTI